MKELYEKTKEFIQENYNNELNEETLDILTVAIMAINCRLGDVSLKKLPSILKRLEIHFGDKSIQEMVSARYPEYPIQEIGSTTNAFVTRALALGDDNKFSEEWSMYVSTKNIDERLVNVVAKTAHELIHLLRFNGIVDGEKESKIRDGVSVARVNKETKIAKRKHYNLEEGIVERFMILSMDSLYEFISDYDVSFSPALSAIKHGYKAEFEPSYHVERFFLEGLTRNKKFDELLEYSFVDESEPLTLVTFYNNAIGDPSGFTRLSRSIDKTVEYAAVEDESNFKKSTEETIQQINGFLAKKK